MQSSSKPVCLDWGRCTDPPDAQRTDRDIEPLLPLVQTCAMSLLDMAVRARRRIAPGYALSAVCCEARCGTPMAGECIIGISQEPRCPPDMLEAAAGFGDENPIGCTACSKKLSEQHRIEQEQRQAAFFRGKRREGPAVCKVYRAYKYLATLVWVWRTEGGLVVGFLDRRQRISSGRDEESGVK